MPGQDCVLHHHKLVHLGPLAIDENIFRGRFPPGCSTRRCRGGCCRTGVWTDLQERDKIVEHADLILSHMDSGQELNPDRWFDAETRADTDFPSGLAFGTRADRGACVFLNSAGRCVLQIASQGSSTSLKPFFCTAFPITVEVGKLAIDEGSCSDCCSFAQDGPLHVFDVCTEELLHVLGEAGLAELRAVANDHPGHSSAPDRRG